MDRRRRALLGAAAALLLSDASALERRVTRKIPSTGEVLPAIGVGTWQTFDVGGDVHARAALSEVLKALVAAGGGMVDSSPMYGSSEAVAGDLMYGLGLREELFVATKVWTRGEAQGIRQMQESFRKLRVEKMDLLQVHNLVDVATHTKTLQDWKAQGKVRYLGITHYTASAYAEVEKWLATKQYDFLQINYSLDERESEKRLLPLAAELGVGVIVNRPFSEGALFRKARGRPLPPWAAELGIETWAQFFLKWIVAHPAVTCAIPGTGRPDHMRDNLAAGLIPLPDEAQRRRMAQHVDSL
jgi:aryl-alcohol dehydrogenase-like predicted oxidoreductase